MDYIITRDDSLALEHYGVKGMKWGVRHDKERSERAQLRSLRREVKKQNRESARNLRKTHRNIRTGYEAGVKQTRSSFREANKVVKDLGLNKQETKAFKKYSRDSERKSLQTKEAMRYQAHYDAIKAYRSVVLSNYEKAYPKDSSRVIRAKKAFERASEAYGNAIITKDPKTGKYSTTLYY